MNVPLLEPAAKGWECPNCGRRAVTRESRPHVEMHQCAAMNGLLAPMVEVTSRSGELDTRRVRLVRVDREDYVGREIVRTDATGRPAMAVVTERADGSNDCHAFAGCAQASTKENL